MFEEAPGQAGMEPAAGRRRLAAELNRAIIQTERRTGRSVDRPELSKRINVSVTSLYAYLNGTTLPHSRVFDALLDALEVPGREAGRLSTLRDAIEVAQRARRQRRKDLDHPAGAVPPRQLPPPHAHFVGRTHELGLLDELRTTGRPPTQGGADPPRTAAVIVISGTPGVGKTALALQWAHQADVIRDFPDGQLYVNLRGFDPRSPMEPDEALHGFLLALGIAPTTIPATLDDKAALFRSVLADRRVLIVADNARSSEQVRPLLPGAGACLTLITSRNRLDGLTIREGARRVTAEVLSPPEALALLGGRVDAARLAADPETTARLVTWCAGLPLALTIAAARIETGPRDSIGYLVEELRQAHHRLEVLTANEADLDLRTVLDWSYSQLSDDAARLFRMLGTHPGPDISHHACAALLDVDMPPYALLDLLKASHLITEHPAGRFGFHDLLRLYANERAAAGDERERRAGLERLLDYYLDAADLANTFFQPLTPRRRPARATSRAGTGPAIESYADAAAWFTAEIDAILAVLALAAEQGFESHAWQLAWSCALFLRRTGRRTQRAQAQRVAIDAATRVGDRHARATSMRLLADALNRLDRREEAVEMLASSLAECQALGDDEGAMHVHLSMARTLDADGRHEEALREAEAAQALARRTADPLAQADGLTAVAVQLIRLGRHGEAQPMAERALGLYQRLEHLEGEADILRSLAAIETAAGRPDAAIADLERSLDLDRRLSDRVWEAQALEQLAEVYLTIGEATLAHVLRKESLAILEALHHPDAVRLRARLDGPVG